METVTRSVNETRALGRRIGKSLTGGLVITLSGDLGSGKTAFVQGLAKGLGVSDDYYVTSPTYAIINEYPGRLPLFHVDLYRLADAGAAADIGLSEILDSNTVVAVEWPEIIAADLPDNRLALTFTMLDDKIRKISIYAYGLQAKSVIRRLGI